VMLVQGMLQTLKVIRPKHRKIGHLRKREFSQVTPITLIYPFIRKLDFSSESSESYETVEEHVRYRT
jgi:hypothetical protein